MRPLKVTAHLSEPIAGDVPMLDAVIERCMSVHRSVAQRLHLHHADPERADYTPGLIPTPIVRRRVEGFPWPIPLCSSPIFRVSIDTHEHYARRFDVEPELIASAARRVYYTTMGEHKSHRLPLRVRAVDRVVWFCCAADARGVKEIRGLLRKQVTHLGKKTSQGFGRVDQWEIGDWPMDVSWFATLDGGRTVLMRPMPAHVVEGRSVVGYRKWYGGVVPPYWATPYFAEMVVPA